MSVLGPWPAPHRARKSCQFRGPFKGASLLCKQALKVTVHILPKACSQLKSHWLSLDQMWFVSTPLPTLHLLLLLFLTLGILVSQLCRLCWGSVGSGDWWGKGRRSHFCPGNWSRSPLGISHWILSRSRPAGMCWRPQSERFHLYPCRRIREPVALKVGR